jgi:hypothetical protein
MNFVLEEKISKGFFPNQLSQVGSQQGDQDEFVKKSPKMWPNPFFVNINA